MYHDEQRDSGHGQEMHETGALEAAEQRGQRLQLHRLQIATPETITSTISPRTPA